MFKSHGYIEVMITYCPHCGHNLPQAIVHGITSCNNCHRVSDSSPFHRLLSAAWLVRKRNIDSEEYLVQFGYSIEEATLVIKLVADGCYSHEEFRDYLKEQGVSNTWQNCIDLAS